MRLRYLAVASLSLFCLVSQANAAAHFVNIAFLFKGTTLDGINAAGTAVGSTVDRAAHFQGIKRTPDGTITNIEIATSTIPVAIDDAGDIAGYYSDSKKGGYEHGFFIAADGTVTKFDPPGSGGIEGTIVDQMNRSGVLTDSYAGEDNVFHGYLRATDGTIVVFDAPGVGTGAYQGTLPRAINDKGATCGNTVDAAGVRHAFIRTRKGVITLFDAPGAGTASGQGSSCIAIAWDGRTLGFFYDGAGVEHAFLRASDGTFTSLDIAGASQTFASLFFGKWIIGIFYDANGAFHSFIRKPSGAIEQIDNPHGGTGPVQGTSVNAINRQGVMVGSFITSNNKEGAFLRIP